MTIEYSLERIVKLEAERDALLAQRVLSIPEAREVKRLKRELSEERASLQRAGGHHRS